jgi:hypothetical protein
MRESEKFFMDAREYFEKRKINMSLSLDGRG